MMPFCPDCGSEHAVGARFCASCGKPLSADEAAATVATAELEDEEEREIWRGSPDPVLSPIDARSTTYVVTSERIKVDRGKLRKKIESVELYRVKDVHIKKTMTQRTRGRGDLEITSVDPTSPEIRFESIERPDDVAEMIRGLVKKARKTHGVQAREGV